MAITITTLNDNAGDPCTYAEVGKDLRNSEWINTTNSSATKDCRLRIRQSTSRDKATGKTIRRSLVQAVAKAPIEVTLPNGNVAASEEQVVVNLTIQTPEGLASLVAEDRLDAVAFIRNLVNATVAAQLVQGQV